MTCLMVTLDEAMPVEPTLSVTVNLKVSKVSIAAAGAVKVAIAVLALVSNTVGPAVWLHK